MGEEEIEEARKQRTEQQKKQMEAKKAEEQLKTALRVALENDAYDRITNVQHANPQLFLTAAQNILALHKRAGRKLNDEELRAILSRIKQLSETETKIRFERK